jgi:hypothetical protein
MRRALGKVSPAGTKLLALALSDRSIRIALRRATREGFFNARQVTTADLDALSRARQDPKPSSMVTRLHAAIRVDPAR